MPRRARSKKTSGCPFVTRGGLKLAFALERFGMVVRGLTAADLGSHIGGFVDCLLQAGAERVFAVDTAYGVLAWRLRQDPRVTVVERTNALHWRPPKRVDLVTLDLAWTRLRHSLPAAADMVNAGGTVLALVKPQYEAAQSALRRGVLPAELVPQVVAAAKQAIPACLELAGEAESPERGSGGNVEAWFHLRRRT